MPEFKRFLKYIVIKKKRKFEGILSDLLHKVDMILLIIFIIELNPCA